MQRKRREIQAEIALLFLCEPLALCVSAKYMLVKSPRFLFERS